MLQLLHIENIAVIERADISFRAGFNALTGETGAGKSIVIDSIGALLGKRVSRDLVRSGAQKGFVSAVFTDLPPALCQLVNELDLAGDEGDTLHIQRQLTADGKSSCRVNMKPVSASTLRLLAPYLIDIHGQNDGQKLLDEQHPDFNPLVDPKCHWAIGHLEQFPLEIMNAEYETLLRVPGIGPISARRIVSARRHGTLRFEDLKKLGVVLKRAQFFITCGGRMRQGLQFTAQTLQRQLEAMERGQLPPEECRQLSLFDSAG